MKSFLPSALNFLIRNKYLKLVGKNVFGTYAIFERLKPYEVGAGDAAKPEPVKSKIVLLNAWTRYSVRKEQSKDDRQLVLAEIIDSILSKVKADEIYIPLNYLGYAGQTGEIIKGLFEGSGSHAILKIAIQSEKAAAQSDKKDNITFSVYDPSNDKDKFEDLLKDIKEIFQKNSKYTGFQLLPSVYKGFNTEGSTAQYAEIFAACMIAGDYSFEQSPGRIEKYINMALFPVQETAQKSNQFPGKGNTANTNNVQAPRLDTRRGSTFNSAKKPQKEGYSIELNIFKEMSDEMLKPFVDDLLPKKEGNVEEQPLPLHEPSRGAKALLKMREAAASFFHHSVTIIPLINSLTPFAKLANELAKEVNSYWPYPHKDRKILKFLVLREIDQRKLKNENKPFSPFDLSRIVDKVYLELMQDKLELNPAILKKAKDLLTKAGDPLQLMQSEVLKGTRTKELLARHNIVSGTEEDMVRNNML